MKNHRYTSVSVASHKHRSYNVFNMFAAEAIKIQMM